MNLPQSPSESPQRSSQSRHLEGLCGHGVSGHGLSDHDPYGHGSVDHHISEPLYGLLAEFPDAASLVHAAGQISAEGYRCIDAYTPFAVHGLAEAIGFRRTRLPLVVLIGGIIGLISGYGMQWWISVVAYPLNIGGRPLNSWPTFIPVTFEMTILVAALSAVLGMLALNGLPRPHHPLFAISAFDRASTDGFFLCVEATDPNFDEARTYQTLIDLKPREVWHVPNCP